MAREAKTTYTIYDDVDGKELPADTKPLNVTLDGTRYGVYVSETNRAKIEETLLIIRSAEKVGSSPRSAGRPAAQSQLDHGADAKTAKAWWNANLPAGEKAAPERGRLPKALIEAWNSLTAAEAREAIKTYSD